MIRKRCNKEVFLKVIATLIVFMVLFFATTIRTEAAPYSQKTRICPSCRHIMYSYGYHPDMTWASIAVNGGNYCAPCGVVIPSDEYHMYLYSSDLYYFRCNNCGGTYSYLYDNPVSEHYTNGVRDY